MIALSLTLELEACPSKEWWTCYLVAHCHQLRFNKAFLLSAHMDDLRILLRLFHEKETRRAIDRARTSNHKNDDFSVSSWGSKERKIGDDRFESFQRTLAVTPTINAPENFKKLLVFLSPLAFSLATKNLCGMKVVDGNGKRRRNRDKMTDSHNHVVRSLYDKESLRVYARTPEYGQWGYQCRRRIRKWYELGTLHEHCILCQCDDARLVSPVSRRGIPRGFTERTSDRLSTLFNR